MIRMLPPLSAPSLRLASEASRLRLPHAALLLAVFALGLALRWHGINDPSPMAGADEELREIQSGYCLLSGVSAARLREWAQSSRWTGFGPNDSAFDHPPLFGALAAGVSFLRGDRPSPNAREREILQRPVAAWKRSLSLARPLALVLFAITFLLVFEVARRAFSPQAGLLAVLLYSALQPIVFGNRLLVAGNLTAPLFLLNLLALQWLEAGRCRSLLFGTVTVLSTAAAMLCHPSAFGQAAAILCLLLLMGRKRELIFPLSGAALGFLLYAIYGWWQGWSLRLALPALQHGLPEPSLPALRYPVFLGWLSLFILALGSQQHARARHIIFLAPLAYLAAFVFVGPPSPEPDLDALPLYPFLCMALAVFVCGVSQRAAPPLFLAAVALLFPYALDVVFLNHVRQAGWLRLLYLAATPALLLIPQLPQRFAPRFRRLVLLAMMWLLLLGEIWAVWFAES